MTAPVREPGMDAVLASVRSVITAVPSPRRPADEREPGGWQSCGRYEIRFEDRRDR